MIKLWGIRHIRYFFLKALVIKHANDWNSIGIGMGINPYDIEQLELIWKGKR